MTQTPKIYRIAIIGAGYSGLATALYLLQLNRPLEITLFDPHGIGGEASKISAGILQKYAGLHAKLNRYGEEAEIEALKLIDIASKALGRSVILSKGILRLALTEGQKEDYSRCANQFSDVRWLEPIECQALDKHLPHAPGIFINSGISIETQGYLEGLFQACKLGGVKHRAEKIQNLADLNHFDVVVSATGALSGQIPELKELKIHPVKGQLIELKWPAHLPPLAFSIVSQAYICMNKENTRCIIGATYEHNFENGNPDPERAINELLPRAVALYPPLKGAEVLDVKAGLRASTPTHLPIIGHISSNLWIISGLGSRGMLYHALYAKKLVKEISATL